MYIMNATPNNTQDKYCLVTYEMMEAFDEFLKEDFKTPSKPISDSLTVAAIQAITEYFVGGADPEAIQNICENLPFGVKQTVRAYLRGNAESKERHRERVKVGKLGGRPKTVNTPANPTVNTVSAAQEKIPSADVSPKFPKQKDDVRLTLDNRIEYNRIENSQKNIKKESPLSTSKVHQLFDSFWAVYPRKVGKQTAYKAFEKAVKGKPANWVEAVLIPAVKTHAASNDWQKSDGQYIPHPTTFLNQGRWEDEIASAPVAQVPAAPAAAYTPAVQVPAEAPIRDRLKASIAAAISASGLDAGEYGVYIDNAVNDAEFEFNNRVKAVAARGWRTEKGDPIHNRAAFEARIVAELAPYWAAKARENKVSDGFNRDSIWFGNPDDD